MAIGTDFGGIHSYRDLNLIQQKVDVQPAEPKLNLINIPGADGSKDASELPGGRLTYNDRTVTWTFALYPGADWDSMHRQVSNALNGKRCRITLDTSQEYYYSGRVVVKKYNTDKLLRQITVEAICSPYLLKQQPTEVFADLTTTPQTLILRNEKMWTVPTFEVDTRTTIIFGGASVTVDAGTFSTLDIELKEGDNVLQAYAVSDTGTIKIIYQEGSL